MMRSLYMNFHCISTIDINIKSIGDRWMYPCFALNKTSINLRNILWSPYYKTESLDLFLKGICFKKIHLKFYSLFTIAEGSMWIHVSKILGWLYGHGQGEMKFYLWNIVNQICYSSTFSNCLSKSDQKTNFTLHFHSQAMGDTWEDKVRYCSKQTTSKWSN